MNDKEKLMNYCLDELNFEILRNWPPAEYNYKYISLCAVDAVFSINTNYKAVKNIIGRISDMESLNPLNEFRLWLDNKNINDYFNNQKVAKRSKIDILKDFIDVLLKFNFYEKDDFKKFLDNKELDRELLAIRGIGPATFAYFFMLTGDENNVKVDRHIKNFISNGIDISVNKVANIYALNLLEKILPVLKNKYNYLSLTLRSFDYLIWSFQKSKSKLKKLI